MHVARVMAEADGVRLAAAGAGGGVVVPASVRRHRRHQVALVGQEGGAGRDVGVALGEERVVDAVALGMSVGVVEERVDRLLALEVDNAQDLTAAQDARPPGGCRDDLVVGRGGGAGPRGARDHLAAPPAAAQNTASVLSKPRTASSVRWRQKSSRAGSPDRQTIARIGFGAQSGSGSSGCGQFDSATSTFISALRSTKSPCLTTPACQVNRPAASVRTGAKKVMHGGMSRRPKPYLPTARMKLSRLLRVASCPYLRRLLAAVLPPSNASWAPELSSVSDMSTRPISDNSTRPLPMAALH